MKPPKSYTPAARQGFLVRACDRLWRMIILLRGKGVCRMCGISKPKQPGGVLWIQAAHIIGRGYWFLRWHPKNGLPICQDCHVDWKIIKWLEKNDPKRLAWLRKMKNKNVPQQEVDLEQVLNNLESDQLSAFGGQLV